MMMEEERVVEKHHSLHLCLESCHHRLPYALKGWSLHLRHYVPFHHDLHHISQLYDSLPEVFFFIWNTFMIFYICHAWWMSLCNLRWMKLLPPCQIRTWLHNLTFSSCEFQPCEHQKQNFQTIKSSKPVLWYQLDLKMKKTWKNLNNYCKWNVMCLKKMDQFATHKLRITYANYT